MSHLRSSALALLCLALAGCPASGPAVFVVVRVDPALGVDQLAFQVSRSGQSTLGPALRPEVAAGPLGAEESVRLALPEAWLGTVTVRVDGLAAGAAVATGTAEAVVRKGAEASAVVTLASTAGCEASTCANGCCVSGLCVVDSFNLCGVSGGTCFSCSASSSDRCVGGECRCGSGPACNPGQACLSGSCTCDATTCPNGCCDGATCLPGNTNAQCGTGGAACSACATGDTCAGGVCPGCAAACDAGCCTGSTCKAPGRSACGAGGSACVACDALRADGCSNGSCACGAGPACAAGQACVGGSCVCNAASCPRGCCAGTTCNAASTATCGADGGSCSNCAATRTDRCSAAGTCACGGSGPCPVGQSCAGGQCLCDGGSCGSDGGSSSCNAANCPTGCCLGGVCTTPSTGTCGTQGGACVDCGLRGDNCTNGVCQCKTSAQCPGGTRCTTSGACVCDTTSGCSGCCSSSTTCVPGGTLAQCGIGGEACAVCNATRTNLCTNGACKCGTNGACGGPGNSCDAGACMF